MSILKLNQKIGSYCVKSFIREGLYNESYRVEDSLGNSYFLKLYDYRKVPNKMSSSDSIITEISSCEKINHPNVIKFVGKGVHSQNCNNYPFLVTQYNNGNLVALPLEEGRIFPLDLTLQIAQNVLKGLAHIHSLGLLHNDITPSNIIYDPNNVDKTVLIDLGHISVPISDIPLFETSDLTPFFRAPETYDYIFDIPSDIYSVAAVIYSMLYGKAPWSSDTIDDKELNSVKVKEIMRNHLSFSGAIDRCPDWLQYTLKLCLSVDPGNRIQTAEDLLNILYSERYPQIKSSPVKTHVVSSEAKMRKSAYEVTKKEGNGFADVAGMDDIKAMLQRKVLFLLRNPEKTKEYKLTPPNGMLLYGPPGCGKTFFAEKFAEEASLNFIFVKASDIGSSYIHGSQNKIAQLFKEAEENAPSVICFDEFDAMVPRRSNTETNTLINPEVNEFLSQMNNCSQRGIFVIGTTNQKELIDPAVLRTGRMDLLIEIGAPDKKTRKRMFDLYLRDRPCSDIDSNILAEMTENYSSSDIAFIVNDAALVAAFTDAPINQIIIEEAIMKKTSSLEIDAKQPKRKKIGF